MPLELISLGTIQVADDVQLSPVRGKHAAEVFGLIDRNRAYLRRWMPWVDDNAAVRDTAKFIRAAEAMQRDDAGIQMGIWYRNVLAGLVGFNRVNWDNRKTDIGYWLGENFQGRGLMVRSCHRLVEVAFRDLELHRIQILCAPDNVRSRTIPERLGFVLEGTLRDAEWLYDHFEHSIVYSLLAPDYRT